MRLSNDTSRYGADYTQDKEPTTKVASTTWFDLTTNKLKVWTGTYWRWDGMETLTGGDLGYSIGGSNGVTMQSLIERIVMPFSGGISAIVGYNQGSLSNYAGAYFNSSTYAYIVGGQEPSSVLDSQINRIQFPFDSGVSLLVGNTESSKVNSGGCNSSVNGYMMGGNIGAAVYTSYISRLVFAGNTYVSNHAYIATPTETFVAGNSSKHGYIAGSATTGGAYTSNIQRMTFASDTINATVNGNLSSSTGYGGVCANSSLACYAVGGISITSIWRINFPFDSGSGTVSAINNLNRTNNIARGCSSTNHYYVMGGSGTTTSIIDRFDFSSDTAALAFVGNLTSTRYASNCPDNTDFVAMFV